ncbi:MAG: hypothetical protein NC489_19630 [Ruminococcus flavefaciens]|nr:hypothetical protein [Ruminococcus flavefaciens]
MEVSDSVKKAYQSNSVTRHITLHFPEINVEIGMQQIYFESMSLSESLVDSESIEFVGCIASKFKIKVNGLTEDVKGRKIVARITTDGTEDEPVVLFSGIVDSALKQSNKQIKEIVAYDELYTKGNTEAAAWYKSLTFPVTLKGLRDSLFQYIGIEQVDTVLPNDDITIAKQYAPNTLQALSVIKAVCQINGAFGIINREGLFEYRILGDMYDEGAYPGPTLFPGEDIFPGTGTDITGLEPEQTDFAFYKDVKYEEFKVCPVDKITIRQSEEDAGVTYGAGDNNYIIQGNMFSYGLADSVLGQIAENIYHSVKGFAYYPFTTDNNGLPFVECGLNVVTYIMIDYVATLSKENKEGKIIYEEVSFPVLNRNLTGIQNLRDSYSAKGEEYQTEFVTDLQTQIDLLKKKQSSGGVTMPEIEEYVGDYIDTRLEEFEGGGGGAAVANMVSVKKLPSIMTDNTVYFIQGEVAVI